MIIVTYDFSNDKTRTRFSKFLEKFGRRIQYSVFEIKNSKRILDVITTEVEQKYKKYFTKSDSVLVFRMNESHDKVTKMGFAENEDSDILFLN